MAKHNPVAVLNGDRSLRPLEITAGPGQTISLDASSSTDLDGDKLKYEWIFYREAGSYKDKIHIEKPSAMETTIEIPKDAKGKTIHVILTVTDNGEPNLTRYRRAVIQVK